MYLSLVVQELLTLSSPSIISGVRVTRSLDLSVCFVDRCLTFGPFSLAIVLSVPHRFTDSGYPFSILKPFLCYPCFVLSTSLEYNGDVIFSMLA